MGSVVEDSEPQRLVEPEFWDEEYFWAGEEPPLRPDPGLPFDRTLVDAFARHARPAAGERVMEIGCAPAKWLVHLGETYGAAVEGLEYTEKGAAFSRRNLEACGVTGIVHHADFFTKAPEPCDYVLSLGFIEHFDDLAPVFSRHVDWVRPGGRLVLGVPNFRGFNGVLQKRADRAYLELHNLDAMLPATHRALAAAHGLQEEFIEFIGGPDPVIVTSKGRLVTAAILAESRVRRLRVTDRINHRWFSSYLFMVFRRPA